jgi:hypothetical protein
MRGRLMPVFLTVHNRSLRRNKTQHLIMITGTAIHDGTENLKAVDNIYKVV